MLVATAVALSLIIAVVEYFTLGNKSNRKGEISHTAQRCTSNSKVTLRPFVVDMQHTRAPQPALTSSQCTDERLKPHLLLAPAGLQGWSWYSWAQLM